MERNQAGSGNCRIQVTRFVEPGTEAQMQHCTGQYRKREQLRSTVGAVACRTDCGDPAARIVRCAEDGIQRDWVRMTCQDGEQVQYSKELRREGQTGTIVVQSVLHWKMMSHILISIQFITSRLVLGFGVTIHDGILFLMPRALFLLSAADLPLAANTIPLSL
ncbi:hypothetical protein VTN96DRAFT_3426 [Rasamsonia emersonii]